MQIQQDIAGRVCNTAKNVSRCAQQLMRENPLKVGLSIGVATSVLVGYGVNKAIDNVQGNKKRINFFA